MFVKHCEIDLTTHTCISDHSHFSFGGDLTTQEYVYMHTHTNIHAHKHTHTHGCECDMFLSRVVTLRTNGRSELHVVSDNKQPQTIKPYHTHNHYLTSLLHAHTCTYSRTQLKKKVCNLFITSLY